MYENAEAFKKNEREREKKKKKKDDDTINIK
jgi:hypothetical protein